MLHPEGGEENGYKSIVGMGQNEKISNGLEKKNTIG